MLKNTKSQSEAPWTKYWSIYRTEKSKRGLCTRLRNLTRRPHMGLLFLHID